MIISYLVVELFLKIRFRAVVVAFTKQGGKKPGLMPNFCKRRRIFPKIGGEVKKRMRISDLKTV